MDKMNMKKVINFLKSLSLKQIVLSVTILLCLFIWAGLTLFVSMKRNSLADQNVAARWSEEDDTAQISCFFTESAQMDVNKILTFNHQLDTVLQEASVTADKENVRLWADAYSAPGTVTLNSGKTKLESAAVGIGGDFFLFHPVQLLAGAYFSGNDLMQDKVIIDEDAAWQLFGSNDVIGMEIIIGGIPHYVSGVIKRAEGRFNEAAGLDKTLVYVSYETLSQYGKTEGINTYEVVMPNPVQDFAYKKVKEKFGIDETNMWVIENSARYHLKGLLTVISEFGTRSMNAHAIRYPYWENAARGWEDVFAAVLIIQIISLLIPAIIVIVVIITLWRHRQWTLKDLGHLLLAAKDCMVEKFRSEKGKWKYF